MVFRRGGKVKVNEKWYYQNKKLDIVSEYKYFTSFLKWRRTQMHQRQQAEKALTVVKSFLKNILFPLEEEFNEPSWLWTANLSIRGWIIQYFSTTCT